MTDVEFTDVLVSRPDIARLTGVKRPAVTNWERRHEDFPVPAGTDSVVEQFRADEVLAWLSGRTVPANALRPGEPVGTTYGDRFRTGLSGGTAGGLLRAIEQLAGPEADRLRGPMPLDRYLEWLLYFVLLRIVEPDRVIRTVDDFGEAARRHHLPGENVPGRLLHGLSRVFGRSTARSQREAREAFDRVLVQWVDAHAREGGVFFTPPSVSRVMTRALAAVRPRALSVHDPYARTGELLVAYLDAVAEHGGDVPVHVSGRVAEPLEQEVARMNLRVHHERFVRFGEGPVTPALDPDHPFDGFDVLLTNPPFGRLRDDVPPPPYWVYGAARRTEFDWLQYAVSRLAPDGRAAVLMPAGAAFNAGAAETVRAGLVEAGVVECVIELPAGLFALTGVKTHIWFLRAPGPYVVANPEVLFVAGAHLGQHVTRTQKALSDDDITRLVGEYVSWYQAGETGRVFAGTPGLSRAVSLRDTAQRDHNLDPARHVHVSGRAPDVTAAGSAEALEQLARLAREMEAQQERVGAADAEVARWLRRYGL
ncbi:SAM-dependent methyltransferase [Streptomyces sp. STR69]|uniref:SAM-dependent methyltransferase n=1 Tax=Streptomyces sp. STR69 TaxID=1796942 RepID=UPI0021C8A0A4|nr:SAM-dependent methyltransferase [Streptomyces sp. STR69]